MHFLTHHVQAVAASAWAALVGLFAAVTDAATTTDNTLLIAFIAVIPGTLLAGATLFVGVMNNRKVTEAQAAALAAGTKVTELHMSIDGRMDELLAATLIKGQVEGAAVEQARAADVAAGAAQTAASVAESVAAAVAAPPPAKGKL